MSENGEEFAARYKEMNDSELLELSRDRESLVGAAQQALDRELKIRNIDVILAEPEEEPIRLVTIRQYRDLSEALVAKSALESAGIDAVLQDANLIRLDWQMANMIGGVRLQVDEREMEAANALLAAPVPAAIPIDEEETEFQQPQCPTCGSHEVTYEGKSRGAALVSLYLFSLPLPFGRSSWRCSACGARWHEDAKG